MPPEESNPQEGSQHSKEEVEESGAPGQESGGRDFGRQTHSADETPDVTLDVPTLNLEEARLQVDNLRARISLQAELSDMVRINVGVDAFLEKVELDLKGLEAQVLLKANLENVRDILGRTLESLDNNPDLIDSLAQMAGGDSSTLEGAAGDLDDERSGEEEKEGDDEESAREIEATDAARSKAEDLGVDLAQVQGTGSGGRVIARDVQKAANQA